MDNLVIIKNNEPLTTSEIISEKLNRTHKSIMNLINTYKNEFEEFGTLSFSKGKSTGGRPIEFVYLNEQQLTFLIMNMKALKKDSDKVLKFKKIITKQFHQMRKWILEQKTQKANQQYIETRNQSKIGRRQETDIIKEFIEYAKKQGSKSADKYYMNFSKMENSAFFIIKEKFSNVREILNINQLSKIIIADIIIRTAIIEGMKKEMYYKDIFQLAKKRVIELSSSLGFKEILPMVEIRQIKQN